MDSAATRPDGTVTPATIFGVELILLETVTVLRHTGGDITGEQGDNTDFGGRAGWWRGAGAKGVR